MTRRELLATAAGVLLPRRSAAKTIFIEMAGGPSHVDTFDLQVGPWTPRWMQPVRRGEALFPAGLMPELAAMLGQIAVVEDGNPLANACGSASAFLQSGTCGAVLVRGIQARSTVHHPVVLASDAPMIRATADSFGDACERALRLRARFVQIRFGSWDHHGDLYEQLRRICTRFDAGVARLVREDVRIVAMGEFGRRPGPLNENGGRDHWPVHAALFA